jgi:osmotically inducible lipoprotein OsmB
VTVSAPQRREQREWNMMRTLYAVVGALALAGAAGCSTWDSMSSRDKATAGGAAAGGVVGAAVTGGGVLGTVGGAAAGGLIGNQIEKERERR